MKLKLKLLSVLLIALTEFPHHAFSQATCRYYESNFGYSCELSSAVFLNQSIALVINGNHTTGRTDANVLFLNATQSTIHLIPNGLFTKFANLTRLHLNNVGFSVWNDASNFDGCKLIHLDLSNNLIATIPSRVFTKCASSLVNLNLSSNQIKQVNSSAFETLSKLESLYMENNQLSAISTGTLHPLIGLSILSLTNNLLDRVTTEMFSKSTAMTRLSLDSNKIYQIQRGFHQSMTKLVVLLLAGNNCVNVNIQNFTAVASNLTQLEQCFVNNGDTTTTTTQRSSTIISRDTTTLGAQSIVTGTSFKIFIVSLTILLTLLK